MLGLSLGPHGYLTDARLRTWHRTLDPRTYERRGQGDHWAIARESTPGSPFWVVARYDWSDPDIVRWTVTESSHGGGGEDLSASLRVRVAEAGCMWGHTDAHRQRLMLFVVKHGPMSVLVSRMWAALDRYAVEHPA